MMSEGAFEPWPSAIFLLSVSNNTHMCIAHPSVFISMSLIKFPLNVERCGFIIVCF
jgi:hypothetical protein